MDGSEAADFVIKPMTEPRIEEYIDVFISVFTKEPWNDVYESRAQVRRFFENYSCSTL